MIIDEIIFVEIDTFSNSQVKMGNCSLVQMKGKCILVVDTKRSTKYIRDVLLVLDLEQELLSVGQLIKHWYSLHLNEVFARFITNGGIYKL